jgi:hypothetical protein
MSPTDDVTALARRFRTQVNMGTLAVPDWQTLIGVEEFKPVYEPRRENDESYDDEGAMRQATTGFAWRLELKVVHRTGSDGVTWNAVQEKLRTAAEANDTQTGEVHIRWFDRNGLAGPNYSGFALVDWAPEGGNPGVRDLVSVALHGQGARTSIANPLADLTPLVLALDPTTGAAAGGNLVEISGAFFDGVTDVDFGAVAAANFLVVDSTRIVATAPAGTGTVQVSVTTAAGTSVDTAADDYIYT